MNVLLVGINSKYIHPAASIYSLAANLKFPNNIMEFTIKDSVSHMSNEILSSEFDLIGISVYIWNIKIVEELLESIYPILLPHQKIVLGGPEVSYDQVHFMNKLPIDYIISGEGEESLNEFCEYMINQKTIDQVSNLTYRENNNIIINQSALPNIKDIKFGHDITENSTSRMVYFEASRGCPFRCSYCIASLEKKVRHFDIEYVKSELLKLLQSGVPTIKFLDRTFNINPQYMNDLIDFIDEYNTHNTCIQFEIVADILTDEVIERISRMKSKCLRFEIGIQSTNIATTSSVNRQQDFEKLKANIHKIQATNLVDLHLDLIAGLPFENYDSFIQTFNQTFDLFPKELQLGFLKMLRGTSLRQDSEKYGYTFQDQAPYEIIDNQFISKEELGYVRLVEECLEKYYNSGFMPLVNQYLWTSLVLNKAYFEFFLQLGLYLKEQHFNLNRYQLDELFEIFYKFIYINYPDQSSELLFYLKQDYLKYFKNRPKIWWKMDLKKPIKNTIIQKYYSLMPVDGLTTDDLYHYSHIECWNELCFVIVYKPEKHQSFTFKL